MKLYYATGTCSLSPQIVAREASIPIDIERVDIRKSPHVTENGDDYRAVNPNSYVPALRLDDGSILTEGVAIVQYLADLQPGSGLAPAAGTRERYYLQQWLTFISSELHKSYSLLFHPEYGATALDAARAKIADRLGYVEKHLTANGLFVLGKTFSAADAYLFTIVGWSGHVKVDLGAFPNLQAYMERVGARPAVQEAMRAEGMKVAA